MSFKTLLGDPFVSILLGLVGLMVLWPTLVCLTILVFLTADPPRSIIREVPIDDYPLYTIPIFNTRCRAGGFLRQHSLHALPALLCLLQGRLTALDLVEIDWTQLH